MTTFTLHDAARRIQGVPRKVPGRESRQMPDVLRVHKELGKAALAWDRTKGKMGLKTFVPGKRRRKVYLEDLNRYIMLRDKSHGVD